MKAETLNEFAERVMREQTSQRAYWKKHSPAPKTLQRKQ